MAAKIRPTTDKDHWAQCELSHVESISDQDNNQIERLSEFYVPDYVVT